MKDRSILDQIKKGQTIIYAEEEEISCIVCKKVVSEEDIPILCQHCGKGGHLEHIAEWLKIHGTCPFCKEILPMPKAAVKILELEEQAKLVTFEKETIQQAFQKTPPTIFNWGKLPVGIPITSTLKKYCPAREVSDVRLPLGLYICRIIVKRNLPIEATMRLLIENQVMFDASWDDLATSVGFLSETDTICFDFAMDPIETHKLSNLVLQFVNESDINVDLKVILVQSTGS